MRAGAFVCLYAGEVIATPEAARRLAEYDTAAHEEPSAPGHALLVCPSGAVPGNCEYVCQICTVVQQRSENIAVRCGRVRAVSKLLAPCVVAVCHIRGIFAEVLGLITHNHPDKSRIELELQFMEFITSMEFCMWCGRCCCRDRRPCALFKFKIKVVGQGLSDLLP